MTIQPRRPARKAVLATSTRDGIAYTLIVAEKD